MTDETIKNALLALALFNEQTLEGHMAILRLIANRFPGLSPTEKQQLLTAIDSDKKRLETLKAVLQRL